MKDGTYQYELEMEAPLGRRRGNLELIIEKNWINGYLTMFTRTVPIRSGVLTGNQITFEGEMITVMNRLPYKAKGTISLSGVELTLTTDKGEYPVKGTLAEMRG